MDLRVALILKIAGITTISAVGIFLLAMYVWPAENSSKNMAAAFAPRRQAIKLKEEIAPITKEDPAPALISSSTKPLSCLFVGDLMVDRHVGERLKGQKIGLLLDGLAGEDHSFFKGYDLIGANLEGAVTDGGNHYDPQNSFDFAFSPERIAEFKDYGFNYFTSANNHFSDQGKKGIEETRRNLDALGYLHSGSSDAHIDGYSVQETQLSGRKIALIGLSMVYYDFDLQQAAALVSKEAESGRLVIVNIHWGSEYQHAFSKHQQAIGRALIDAGAAAVIGHHPHVVQGLEIYQGKPIFYSLGNFIFDQYFSADTQEGLAVSLEFRDDRTDIAIFPLRSQKASPQLMAGSEKENFLKKFWSWSLVSAADKAAIKD